ncbi:MAG: hypothetical protein U9P71_05135 [Campylobacterota bacterium]|nr:hypothetical protein [Campylobacterota bacterium]
MVDYSHIEIIKNKYLYLSEGALKGLCSKFGIDLYFGADGYDIATKTIPELFSRDGYLENFYHKLEPKEKKILKFIVNYGGDDLQKAVKKKFKFEIVIFTKNKMRIYVWWLELFIDNNHFDDYLKDIFLSFLSENRRENQTKRSKTKKAIEARFDTVDDITKVIITKCDINGEAYPQTLKEYDVVDTVLNVQLLYTFCLDKKIKMTQKRQLAKVSQNILQEQFLDDFEEVDYLNFLINSNYLVTDKEITPANKFIKLMANSGGEIIKKLYSDFIQLHKIVELEYAMFRVSLVKGSHISLLRARILEIIKAQDNSQWINVDFIVDKISLDAKTLKQITNDYDYCYHFKGNSLRGKFNAIEHLKVVVRYFVKSFIGLMHQFGLCKMAYTEFQAYNKEDVRILGDEKGARYANIEFFKLSELGLFALGLQKQFKDSNEYKVILNEYTLEFKVEGANSLSDIFLNNISTQLTDEKYKTDIKTFMKNITKKSEYKQIESSFLQRVDNVPQNWRDFFMLFNERQESMSVVSSSCVLIKVENSREVLKLMSANKKLQEKILKADKMHIVVLKSNLEYVKKAFKEYGVLI